MMPEQYPALIEKTAGLIRSARHAVAFTGAGISTPSGIPDFRSAQTGLWEKDDPMEVASLTSFFHTPERFFNWLRPLARSCIAANPNAAHIALADLEKAGYLKAVITQNIDDLHSRAGSRIIMELHGSLRSLTCQGCHQVYSSQVYFPDFIESGIPPTCPVCHALLKPDIVLFEEGLPATTWYQAEAQARQADLMIVVGSSLTVTPAAYIPQIVVESGAKVIIINRTPTYLDKIATVRLPLDVAEVLPAIAKQVL